MFLQKEMILVILEAASRLLASNFLHPILVGNPDEIAKVAEESGFNIRGAEIIDPMKYDRFDEMVEMFCELRKSKGVTPEQARGILSQANYFGTMLVKWELLIPFLVEQHTLQQIQYVRHYS